MVELCFREFYQLKSGSCGGAVIEEKASCDAAGAFSPSSRALPSLGATSACFGSGAGSERCLTELRARGRAHCCARGDAERHPARHIRPRRLLRLLRRAARSETVSPAPCPGSRNYG